MFRPRALLCALATATALLPAVPARAAERAPSLRFGACPDSVPKPTAPDRVECARIRVPLDWDDPRGPRIEVAVSRVPASGTPAEHRGALLVNPGGPGGSGLPYAVTKRARLPERVRRAYDVIGFDPRGVGQSTPAGCGPMGGLFDSPGADPVPVGPTAEGTSWLPCGPWPTTARRTRAPSCRTSRHGRRCGTWTRSARPSASP